MGYYAAVGRVDPIVFQAVVSRIAEKPIKQIPQFHRMFLQVRFLEDYSRDDGLLMRINQVLSRIPLEPISSRILDWFPSARQRVAAQIEELIPEPVALLCS